MPKISRLTKDEREFRRATILHKREMTNNSFVPMPIKTGKSYPFSSTRQNKRYENRTSL